MAKTKTASRFHFKQFRVLQNRAAMRITTHACILGAWVPVGHCKRVLDIGAGTGVLSLMLAQRSTAVVDAVEIEPGAAADSRENFANSPWPQRLRLFEMPVQLFDAEMTYDCIVSNPPFFSGSVMNADPKKALARHEGGLMHDELLAAFVRLLSEEGHAHILLPADSALSFLRSAAAHGFYLQQRLDIRSMPDKAVDRVILSLGWHMQLPIKLDSLSIHADDFPRLSNEYASLMRDFYPHL